MVLIHGAFSHLHFALRYSSSDPAPVASPSICLGGTTVGESCADEFEEDELEEDEEAEEVTMEPSQEAITRDTVPSIDVGLVVMNSRLFSL